MMKYTFLFPGQGSQKVGMGKDFFDSLDIAKKRFDEANSIIGRDLSAICFNGPEESLTATQNTQPALFTVEAIITDVLREKGMRPSYVVGHSLGEYSALYAAGFISFSDGIKLVAKRGELMANAGKEMPGTMAAILGLPKEQVREILTHVTSGIVVCANENSQEQSVISGEIAAIKEACELLKAAGAKRALPLPVSGAFHSPLMQKPADEFASFIANYTFKAPDCPVIANVTAQVETSADRVKELLIRQLVSPVRWVDSMLLLARLEPGQCIETGPGSVLRNLAKKCHEQLNVLPCDTVENLYSLVQ
jgi:[acyl-carrier-protein] S-malonyltransferase